MSDDTTKPINLRNGPHGSGPIAPAHLEYMEELEAELAAYKTRAMRSRDPLWDAVFSNAMQINGDYSALGSQVRICCAIADQIMKHVETYRAKHADD